MIKKYLFNKTLKNNKNKEKFMKIKFKLLKNIKKKSTISCPHYLIFIILKHRSRIACKVKKKEMYFYVYNILPSLPPPDSYIIN